jgi:hypothetical protein
MATKVMQSLKGEIKMVQETSLYQVWARITKETLVKQLLRKRKMSILMKLVMEGNLTKISRTFSKIKKQDKELAQKISKYLQKLILQI